MSETKINADDELIKFFQHVGDCASMHKNHKYANNLTAACVKATFCPVESDNVTDCYRLKDGSPQKCFVEEARLSHCLQKLISNPSSLTESASIKLAYFNAATNNKSKTN
ncbi:hypothetical protein SAMD00019534_111850, partial [Acytostelium subglobosum LB1]|uniref:hypothetical protein n=1 Tax=Acytostelium subglobosum LB1 TaxID=1410327 RepID=UPI0006451788